MSLDTSAFTPLKEKSGLDIPPSYFDELPTAIQDKLYVHTVIPFHWQVMRYAIPITLVLGLFIFSLYYTSSNTYEQEDIASYYLDTEDILNEDILIDYSSTIAIQSSSTTNGYENSVIDYLNDNIDEEDIIEAYPIN